MPSEVTVLIPSFNTRKYLREAMESVFNQTYKRWKIIIIDDDCKQDSLSTIQDLLRDERVRLIRNDKNLGKSKSLNKALKIVDTLYVMELDSDDWLSPDALEVLVREMNGLSEDVALLTGDVIHVYEDIHGRQKNLYVRTIRTKGRSFKERKEILLKNYIPYPRFYRFSALQKIGGFPTDDPWEGRYVDDLFVFLRLLEHFSFHWINHILYYYRLHGNNKTNNREIIGETLKWIYLDSIKRWGDDYEPLFKINKEGWTVIDQLHDKEKNN